MALREVRAMGNIIVGVDGSDGSVSAAQFGIDEARLRDACLELVCVYQSPAAWLGMGEALGSTVSATISEEDLAEYARESIDEVLGKLELPEGVEVVKTVIEGHAGAALADASRGATMLVVGSSGHSDLGSVLLGSVGMHCVHHASCPVVVVPHQKRK
jgi:nucleotide-binding universal stress UspA family protein